MSARWLAAWLTFGLALPGAGQENAREFDHEQAKRWVDDLGSGDSVAREVAARELIGCGAGVVPYLEPLFARDLPAASELALARVYGALLGVSPAEAEEVRGHLRLALQTEGEGTLREAVRQIAELGSAALQYATTSLQSQRPGERSLQLTERLQVVRNLTDLDAGHNLGDRAVLDLRALGESALDDLLALATDERQRDSLRQVATDRLLVMRGTSGAEDALRIARSASPRLLDLVVPYLCDTLDEESLPRASRTLLDAITRQPRLGASLNQLADRMDPETLRGHLGRNGPQYVAALSARLLGMRRDHDAREALRNTLHRREILVVREAASALGRIGEAEDVSALTRLVAHDEVELRRTAAQSLSLFRDPSALAWSAAMLRDQDPAVRATATRALASRGDHIVVDMLIACLDDAEPSVVQEAAVGLQRITGHTVSLSQVWVTPRAESSSLRDAWRSWWDSREAEENGDDEASTDSEEETDDPARPLAGEGRRILHDLEEILRLQFRPYGVLKSKKGTSAENLLAAARSRMLEVLGREPEEDVPELVSLDLQDEDRNVVRHLVQTRPFSRRQ